MNLWIYRGQAIKPRHEAFRLYWHFASERHQILLRRLQGQTRPWTDDSVLDTHKFCNTFRVADRVTQYYLKHVAYVASCNNLSRRDQAFRAIVFRFFSREDTWAYLESELGLINATDFDENSFGAALTRRRDAGHKLYTGAFILCANNAFGFDAKHLNHAALFSALAKSKNSTLDRMAQATSVSELYDELIEVPLIGKFMAYQIAIDINYCADYSFDESEFVAAGPGAERGVRKCFESVGTLKAEDVITWVQQNQRDLARFYGYTSPTLFGRPLQSIDCQGLFCETDKYCRAALPELQSSRSRIKSVLRPRAKLDSLVSPVSWGIKKETVQATLRSVGSLLDQKVPESSKQR